MGVGWQRLCILIIVVCSMNSAPIYPEDQNAQTSLNFAVKSFNFFSKDDQLFKISKIVNSQVKDLGGLLYLFDIELSKTVCRKKTAVNLATCPTDNSEGGAKELLCHFEVLFTFWRDERTLLKSSCNPAK
ncbi:cystatin-like [Narcine bancroftii]|uniref:cystatin-like n=1 Tax=Narcine bancroftii TaxID=1343680 RepID=UPI003831D715